MKPEILFLAHMSYQHEHIPFYEPEAGYTRTAPLYAGYHSSLNKRDLSAIKQYLPRSIRGKSVLDLGGGDGRLAVALHSMGYESWTIVDVTQSLLDRAPARIKKVRADLRETLPLEDRAYDLVVMSFVLLHLDHIDTLFTEARRCIRPDGRMVLTHHYERRPYIHQDHEGSFKIKTRHRSHEDVTAALTAAGREVDVFPCDDLTNIYCCFPS